MEKEQQRMTQNLFVAMAIFAMIFVAVIFLSGDGRSDSSVKDKAAFLVAGFVDSQIVYTPSIADSAVPKIRPVIEKLVQTCEGMQLLIYHGDIDSMHVDIHTTRLAAETTVAVSSLDLIEEYGWSQYLEVWFVVAKDPVTAVAKENKLAADTLKYYLGAGEQPGIFPEKTSGEVMCQTDPEDADRRLVSVPEFADIDSL